jgi:phosphoenolpyruvate carboxylase
VSVNQDLLRRDVRLLGDLLGDCITELVGSEALALVEEIRYLARQRRSGAEDERPAAEARMAERIRQLSESEARIVSRAFSVYFDLANLAEDRHRVRVLRSREAECDPAPRKESLGAAILDLKSAGFSAPEVQQAIDRLAVELVFTAHPSEAKRRLVRSKVRRMREAIEELDRQDLLPRERRRLETRLRTELTVLWQTEFLRPTRPTVLDEVERGLSFLPHLWSVVPQVFRDLRRALRQGWSDHEFRVPVFLQFGSWIGGDRDGHPDVRAPITERTLLRMRSAAIDKHLAVCEEMCDFLTISADEVPVDHRLAARLSEAAARWPELDAVTHEGSPGEIYRHWLAVIRWRLERSRTWDLGSPLATGAYRDGRELAADLEVMIDCLPPKRAEQPVEDELSSWLDLARVFGLHTARLDVRQDARRYCEVITELFAKLGVVDDFTSLPEPERQAVLARTMPWRGTIAREGLSENTLEALDLFQLLERAMRTFGAGCLGAHVISLTSAPSDVLTVLWLWRWAQCQVLPADVDPSSVPEQLSIAPLFEKIGDLKRSPATLEAILENPVYTSHLAKLDNRQMVMVGYSDSTKDGGYLAACWGLYRGQSELQRVADRYGVQLTFFHGRGGSLGRGGGPAARGIFSLPPDALDGSLRLTEQGEVLAERYDDEQIAYRHLEQVTSATLLASALPARTVKPAWSGTMEQLSRVSFDAYRALVEEPGFIEYFGAATPIDEIEQLPIGSRPSRRRGQRTLDDLRAIPWVFSWTQNRCIIPAWYGLGAAAQQLRERDPNTWQTMYEMYRQWPFFQATIDNAALALAKADMYIAGRYAELAESEEVRSRIWTLLSAERDRTRQAIIELTGGTDLLSPTPWLQQSIDVRNPYIDPLNLIQIELLRRRRALPPEASIEEQERLRGLLRLTVQGIAAGMRTTG